MFSKACEYGLRAVVVTASNSERGEVSSLKDIANSIDSPESFTAKILQKLVREKIIRSTRGAYGGFSIQREDLNSLTISRVVEAIDGDSIYKGCAMGLKDCSDTNPCPVHNKFKKVRDDLRKMLESTTLEELASQMKAGKGNLK